MHSINNVYLNRIATAVPANDGHAKFISFLPHLIGDERVTKLVSRLAAKSQIEHRYTVLKPALETDRLDEDGFFELGRFASTSRRMQRYQAEALPLAKVAVAELLTKGELDAGAITHLIVTSCTGFYAPGLDLELQRHFKMRSDLERTIIGFMGCYAGLNGLKTAWHVVRSQPEAKVLIVNLELCSLHLQQDGNAEKVLGFLQFADGCAASLVSREAEGIRLESFRNAVFPEASEQIQWQVGDHGFAMTLAMEVPQTLGRELPSVMPKIMSGEERAQTRMWAIHPGGRSILDAVQVQLELTDAEIAPSRAVLRNYGNMSSASISFVLKSFLDNVDQTGWGLALAFGPGLTVESMRFSKGKV